MLYRGSLIITDALIIKAPILGALLSRIGVRGIRHYNLPAEGREAGLVTGNPPEMSKAVWRAPKANTLYFGIDLKL